MRIESTSFTDADYDAIVEGYFERERRHLLDRLRALPDQVDALVPLEGAGRTDDEFWNALEILAHIAIDRQGSSAQGAARSRNRRADRISLGNRRARAAGSRRRSGRSGPIRVGDIRQAARAGKHLLLKVVRKAQPAPASFTLHLLRHG